MSIFKLFGTHKSTKPSVPSEETTETVAHLESRIAQLTKEKKELTDSRQMAFKVVQDADKTKRHLEEALVHNEALFASIAEGIIATDKEGSLTKINHAACAMLGIGKKEHPVGKHITKIFPLETEKGDVLKSQHHPVIHSLEQGKGAKRLTHYYTHNKKNERLPIKGTITPVHVGNKKIGAIVVFRDITEEQKVERAKTEFVSFASHQLRSPISAINWYAETLLKDTASVLTIEQQSNLTKLYSLSQQTGELIDSFLDLTRIEMGTFADIPEPFVLPDFVEQVIEELSVLIKKKAVQIKKEIEPALPPIVIARQFLHTILQNLLSNAVKYVGENGIITILGRESDGGVELEVRDNGCGIPQKDQEKIFTKLFRAENVRHINGTGLGLYLVKFVVEQCGGKIWFTSEENKGTSFFVRLPNNSKIKKSLRSNSGQNAK